MRRHDRRLQIEADETIACAIADRIILKDMPRAAERLEGELPGIPIARFAIGRIHRLDPIA